MKLRRLKPVRAQLVRMQGIPGTTTEDANEYGVRRQQDPIQSDLDAVIAEICQNSPQELP